MDGRLRLISGVVGIAFFLKQSESVWKTFFLFKGQICTCPFKTNFKIIKFNLPCHSTRVFSPWISSFWILCVYRIYFCAAAAAASSASCVCLEATAATKAAPLPDPSSESIRSNCMWPWTNSRILLYIRSWNLGWKR